MKSNRFLKKGYTTGSCAAAAAKAAVMTMLNDEIVITTQITLPKGESISIDITDTQIDGDSVTCTVKKYSGDDPDITNGILVCATVRKNSGGIKIDGGVGVGRVTRNGLDQPVGNAAINSVPRQMIRNSINEICGDYDGGFDVIISVPNGEEIAKKTFNSRLGIEGGISILGTSGIVEPMSEKALLDTIFLELNTRKSAGDSIAVLVPGNYGEDFAKKTFGIKNTVQCSNYIGDAIDYASDLGFSDILIISHMGKLVKLGSGIMNTHSKYADGRMETLALCAALAGVDNFADILDCVTTDEAYEIIGDTKTIDILMKRIDKYLKHRSDVNIGAIMFLNKQGIIGKTADVDSSFSGDEAGTGMDMGSDDSVGTDGAYASDESDEDDSYSGSSTGSVSADTSALESALETASDELAELQSDLASQKAVAEADSTSLTKEEKDKLEVTDNLSELDAKSAKELVKEGKKGITAEFNGIVSRADIKEGASVSQGMELFTIQNTDKASVDVNLSKYDYDTVKEGQKAEITMGDNTYEGTVTRMSHIAVQNEKGTPVISATVSIDNPDEDIFLGVDAKVKIHTASAKNVVLLPVEVVNIGKEGSFCYVIEDGLVTRRNITTGISSQDYVEVTEGIKAGEQVISDLGDYTEGMAVEAVQEGAGTAEDSGTTAEMTDVEEADAAGTKNETGDGADD